MSIITPPGASKKQARAIIPPAGFPWPAAYAFSAFGSNGRFSTDINPRSLVNPGIWASNSFIHVDAVLGNNTTAAVVSDPLDTSLPAATIRQAITLGNATGGPFRILVKAGTFNRNTNMNLVSATQHFSMEAWGGRVVHHQCEPLTWTLDGTQTNCYTSTRTGMLRVLDTVNKDAYGRYTELTQVASAALCNSTPGSWFQSGGNAYVRRSDGAVVSDANTRCTLTGVSNFTVNNAVDVYTSGFDFEGGPVVTCISAVTRNLVFEDCTFRYSGSLTAPANNVSIDNMTGIAAFFRCDASRSTKDGFNFHWASAGASKLYALTVDCTAYDCGSPLVTSCNGWTSHDGVVGVDINGQYGRNYGATVHSITGARTWCVGTIAEQAYGDLTASGGVIASCGFACSQPAGDALKSIMWLDNTLSRGNLQGIRVYGGLSEVYTRGHRSSAGLERADSGSVLGVY